MPSSITLQLPHKRNNPRNSEGAFIDLSDGRVLFVYTRYYGNSWSDNAPATISALHSGDGGLSWSKRSRVVVANEGGFNVMSPSLLRLNDGRLGLFYLKKNHLHDCRLFLRTSDDEGRTWSEATRCIPAPGYFVVNNDRVVRLKSGRLLIPAAYHRPKLEGETSAIEGWDWRAIALFYYSDDDGRTWSESDDWWGLPAENRSGMQEPGLVELKDGSLYAWARTDTGRQWQMTSPDQGASWSPPQPSPFLSPCSALSMKRIPATGDLLAVWNDHSPKWELGKPFSSSWGRTPLVAAISSSEGRSWKRAKLLETDRRRGFCYPAIHFHRDAILLAYSCGGVGAGVLQDLCVRRVSLDWLYGPAGKSSKKTSP